MIDNGQVSKDVALDIDFGPKSRIVQDSKGHFYIIAMSQSGNALNIYPGSASDTDGTQLNAAVVLDISKFPGCTNYDFCHSPTFTSPRNGNVLSDSIDGTYGNFNQEIYFRIQLRGGSAFIVPGASTASQAATAFVSASPSTSAFLADEKKGYRTHV